MRSAPKLWSALLVLRSDPLSKVSLRSTLGFGAKHFTALVVETSFALPCPRSLAWF